MAASVSAMRRILPLDITCGQNTEKEDDNPLSPCTWTRLTCERRILQFKR